MIKLSEVGLRKKWLRRPSAQSLLEYSLIIALVATGIILMTRYVFRGTFAGIKGWEDQVNDSLAEQKQFIFEYDGPHPCPGGDLLYDGDTAFCRYNGNQCLHGTPYDYGLWTTTEKDTCGNPNFSVDFNGTSYDAGCEASGHVWGREGVDTCTYYTVSWHWGWVGLAYVYHPHLNEHTCRAKVTQIGCTFYWE